MKVATCNVENETGPVDLGDAVYFKGKTLREQTTDWLIACSKQCCYSAILNTFILGVLGRREGVHERG